MIRRACTPLLALAAVGFASPAWAQGFDSGSDGSDGALNFDGGGVIDFDAAGLDVDGDGVLHLTTINVAAGTTVRLRSSLLGGQGRPVVWLAQGAVTISGTLDLSGDNGSVGNQTPGAAEAGAGGFNGGRAQGSSTPPSGGAGPGGGGPASDAVAGGPAGHRLAGAGGNAPGAAYGNRFVLPLLGGSGGGGGWSRPGFVTGGGGGAGGGAILIASSTSIEVAGTINARGGFSGTNSIPAAGLGSGGAIRLVAPSVTGAGVLDVRGGVSTNTDISSGWIRLEAFSQGFSGTLTPIGATTQASPGLLFPPANAPRVQVTAVDGVAVAANPTASFVTPDVVIDSDTPVTITIAAQNVPVGETVTLRMVSEDGASITVVSSPLSGTLANSTASAGPITVPPGFSRFFVTASFDPQ